MGKEAKIATRHQYMIYNSLFVHQHKWPQSQYYSFSISVVLTFIFSTTDIPFQYYCVFRPSVRISQNKLFYP